MQFSRALAFSIALPLANLMAIHLGALATTGLLHGFTSELVAQSLGILAKQLSLGWLAVVAMAALFSFAAWLLVQRANAADGLSRLLLLGAATGVAAILPAGLAFVVFGNSILGLAIVLAVTGSAIFAFSRDNGTNDAAAASAFPSNDRMGFGQRRR